ncbi:ABC transporter substrate-binding protein [Paenibacillus fonticola]|uniref:ABC transporter substrate-binding protein n=1 Tax=Paenibacillus fonticola TaxID=379896 RepID=UPI000688F318|nr:ABC transporter substrate-binding protein [Paenibacillus fonticola]
MKYLRMKYLRWKKIMVSISVLSLTMLVSACIGGDSKSEGGLRPLPQGEEPTIKVMYYYDESEFFRDYGTLFVSKFPNINVEVLNMQSLENWGSLTDEDIYKFIEEEKPDVLLLGTNQYEKLAGEGKLYALDPLITQDKFDLEGINPSIVKLLRDKGGGSLYGLTPTFNSQALIYNVDLFQKYGIEPPTDSMSWEEVFALANRFSTNGGDQNRVYGFGLPDYSDYADLAYTIGLSNELRMVKPTLR